MKFFKMYIFALWIFISSASFGQFDSIVKVIGNCAGKDSAKLLNKLSIHYRFSDQDTAMFFAKEALKSSTKYNLVKEQGNAYNSIGVQNHLRSKYDEAMKNYFAALACFEKINYPKGLASANLNIGNVHNEKGEYSIAIKYFELALKYAEEQKDKRNCSGALNNLATVYFSIKNIEKSIEYHFKALKLREELGDSLGLGITYDNLGVCYSGLKNYTLSIEMHKKSQEISRRLNDKRSLAISLNNIGHDYFAQNNFLLAEKNFLEGIEISKQEKNYFELNDLYYNMVALYKKKNDFKQAYTYFELYSNNKDSIFSIESKEKELEIENKYQSEHKEVLLKKAAEEITLANKLKEEQELTNSQQKKLLWISLIGLIGISFFAFMAYINFKKSKRSNIIINNQNQILEIQKQEVEQQKHLVEEKQNEIIDSINYAKNIQQAMLPDDTIFNKISPDYFILFQPKDIVSGDFYWAYNTPNGRSIWVVADCTGHGVPGAFMSMLGNSLLNEIIVENRIYKSNEILNRLRDKVISALSHNHQQRNDGMDICVCVWNKIEGTVEFSGANNSLILVSNEQITEIKGDKMPIGNFTGDKKLFTSHTIQVNKHDCIYLYTDGYADQFGGPKGKKFKYKQLEDSLINISKQPMQQQYNLLLESFKTWKNDLEQVDDVCVVGIKI